MRNYIEIGCAPVEEEVAQVGTDDYHLKAHDQCTKYIKLLRSKFGKEPDGAELKIKYFQHDFGTYMEVVCWYDDDKRESVDYAFELEREQPEHWDED